MAMKVFLLLTSRLEDYIVVMICQKYRLGIGSQILALLVVLRQITARAKFSGVYCVRLVLEEKWDIP